MDKALFYNYAVDEMRSTQFPTLRDVTYVDHAGATLYARSQVNAVHEDLCSNLYGNPHSGSSSSTLTADLVDQLRFRILKFFNTSPEEYSVVFTGGCTAALKLLAESFSFSACPPSGQEASSSPSPSSSPQAGRRGVFCYLQDNHTSVQGMRVTVAPRTRAVLCVTEEGVEVEDGKRRPGVGSVVVWGSLEEGECVEEEEEEGGEGQRGGGRGGGGNHLFVFPAQSNFSGRKYPLRWVEATRGGRMGFQRAVAGGGGSGGGGDRWFVALDAASLVSTSPLDLGDIHPDFVTLSFYKMFGFPTGLGALLVRNSSSWVLERRYYGGGTVAASTATHAFCALRAGVSDRFEDGTLPYLDIISLRHGFDTLESLAGGMDKVSSHTFLIAQYFAQQLTALRHSNGRPLAEVYARDGFQDPATQGPIVAFNLRRANGDYIGFAEVDKLAQLHDIHLRTGCFCNIGACQTFLGISDTTIMDNLNAGHVCGDDRDLMDGRPTGSVRVSFGYMSALTDAARCLDFLASCFLHLPTPTTTTPTPLFTAHPPPWFRPPLADTGGEVVGREGAASAPSCGNSVVAAAASASSSVAWSFSGKTTIHQEEGGGWRKEDVDARKKKTSPLQPRPQRKEEEEEEEADRPEKTASGGRDCGVPETALLEAEGRWRKAGRGGGGGGETKEEGEKVVVEPEEEEEEGKEEEEEEEAVPRKGLQCSEKQRVLTDIFLYPVKSCGAFRVEEWELGERGLLYDRTWMIVGHSGVPFSQKREPRLPLLKPLVHLRSATLELTFPGMTSYSVPLEMDDEEGDSDVNVCSNKICNDRVRSRDCGDGVAGWLSDALQRPGLRLLRQLDRDSRLTRRKDLVDEGVQSTTTTTTTSTTTPTTSKDNSSSSGKLSLANESQYLVICRESVRSLAKKLAETREEPQEDLKDLPHSPPDCHQHLGEDDLVERFRANLVVDGGLPFDEDRWTRMTCGDVQFVGQGQCSRCGMICLNQNTGEKTREPLRTLAAWRGGKVYFGVYMRKLGSEDRPLLRVGSAVSAF
ncbi:molybdenum cofactor sulfurase-like [Babylonia areolata]|uniref:molybdenum cofactor sulfurase-like n=1 Tax=Babylonia areolata TaxID=304850 RepID=UPI003FD29F0D